MGMPFLPLSLSQLVDVSPLVSIGNHILNVRTSPGLTYPSGEAVRQPCCHRTLTLL